MVRLPPLKVRLPVIEPLPATKLSLVPVYDSKVTSLARIKVPPEAWTSKFWALALAKPKSTGLELSSFFEPNVRLVASSFKPWVVEVTLSSLAETAKFSALMVEPLTVMMPDPEAVAAPPDSLNSVAKSISSLPENSRVALVRIKAPEAPPALIALLPSVLR